MGKALHQYLVTLFLSIILVSAQPGGGGGGAGGGGAGGGGAGGGGAGGGGGAVNDPTPAGQSTSTECTITSGDCALNGSSNYFAVKLTYDTSSGYFNGSIVSNLCSNYAYGLKNGTRVTTATHSVDCISQLIPDPDFNSTKPIATSGGRIAMTINGGVTIYRPFEAGFRAGDVCAYGTCDAGVDVPTCEQKMIYDCKNTTIDYGQLPDDCGGHGSPYHLHSDFGCSYSKTDSSAHSPLIAITLDGRGMYGKWEASGQLPSDLDACNGHYGPVPAYTKDSVSFPAATNVYHYHISDTPPYTVGCFGPVTSLAQCKSLSSDCGTGFSTFCTDNGQITYDTGCSCYKMGNETYNQAYTQSSACASSTTTGTKAATSYASATLTIILSLIVCVSFLL